jgi:hypothetical protein
MDWIDLAQDRDHGNKPSRSIKCLEFLGYLDNRQLLKKGSAP